MKKLFLIVTGVVIFISIAIIIYGSYLNYKSENVIKHMFGKQTVSLKAEKVAFRDIYALIKRKNVNLQAQQMTDAVSRIEGNIATMYVGVNSKVKKGQPICTIENEEIPLKIAQIDSNIAKTNAEYVYYESTYNRYKKLYSLNAISLEKTEEAESSYLAIKASLEALNAEKQQYLLMDERKTIFSPIDGEVLMLYNQAGSYITAGTSVALICNFEKMFFREDISGNMDESLRFLSNNTLFVAFSVDDLEKVYHTSYKEGNLGSGEQFPFKLVSVTPPLNMPAKMRRVVWEIDNSIGMLEPRRYNDVRIYATEPKKALTIPKSALMEQKDNFVYIQNSQGVLELKEVTTGIEDEKFIEIVAGLSEGDIVITSGKEGISPNMPVSVNLDPEA